MVFSFAIVERTQWSRPPLDHADLLSSSPEIGSAGRLQFFSLQECFQAYGQDMFVELTNMALSLPNLMKMKMPEEPVQKLTEHVLHAPKNSPIFSGLTKMKLTTWGTCELTLDLLESSRVASVSR